jgi:hypothetical protein
MSELAAIQSAFAAALAPGGKPVGAASLFCGDAAGVTRRMGIYRGNVQANALKALGAMYPVLAQIVGTDFFAGLARAYANRFPSTSGDLNEFGGAFGDFLAGFEPAQELPYLPDVAHLEWRVHNAHYAADHPRLDSARLAQIDENDYAALRMALHPACTVLQSPWPLARIWEVHQADFGGAFEVDLDAGPGHALVFRPELRVEVRALSLGEHAFLARASRGESLGAALDAALAAESAFMLDAAFTRWVTDRVVVGLKTA